MIENIISLTPWMGVVLIIIGCVALIKGADWLVEGASSIAKRFGISDLVIGLTVVAFGTSMPEFVVNMVSVANNATDLAITNVLGSNIINIFIILGLSAVVYPIASQKRSRQFDIPYSILAAIVVLVCVLIHGDGIDRAAGIVMLVLFVIFLYNTFKNAKSTDNSQEETITAQPQPVWKALIAIVGGLLGLIIGGELIVKSAVNIATRLGVSEAIIGLTIVALGTSLPELATSVIAAMKKNADIALGNVIGSNIFNIFLILGTSAVIKPLPAYQGLALDACMAALGSVLVWLFIQTNRKRKLTRWGGATLLLCYAAYLTYRIVTL